ncbi:MAG: lysophospholipid acyltransferase family protein [Cyclobacteriaceae bacterium]|nr:lysophospholipid acyltransferase family protein [Cyclobacteriaceae bacterium]
MLSDCIFMIGFYLVKYRRKMISRNLANSFPNKSTVELAKIEKEFFKNLCDYAVETIKLLTLPAEELKERMRFTNPDILKDYADKNQSLILLSSHQFNWEWLVVAGTISLPMKIDFVYQSVQNKFFDKVMLAIRSRFGAYPIERYQVAREIVKRKNIVRATAIVADQYPGRNDKYFSTNFLNQETAFFFGSQQMATLMQYPVFFASVKKVKRGYYEISLLPCGNPPYEKNDLSVIKAYTKGIEQSISQQPENWLWSHNRWKQRHLEKQYLEVKED